MPQPRDRYGSAIVSTVLLAVGWLMGWILFWRLRPLDRSPSAPAGTVAVIIPARDEAQVVPYLLAGLKQRRPEIEVVVVDDQSVDGTTAVARAAGATVIEGTPPPDGWAGKTWACWQGVQATTGERLVFFDADVELAPGALAAVLAAHDHNGGLLSVVPRHRVERAYEYLSVLPNIVSIMGSGAALPRPSRSPAAFGPCLVTSREDYVAVGGHRAVAGSVLDDVDLGRAYRDRGLPVTVVGGGEQVGYRMYPGGPTALVEGWTKNLAGGAGRIPAWRALATALWVTATLSGTTAILIDPVTAAIAYVVVAAQVELLSRRVGTFRRGTGLLHPVLALAFLVLFVGATLAVVRGDVRWKDRTIPLRS